MTGTCHLHADAQGGRDDWDLWRSQRLARLLGAAGLWRLAWR